MGFVLAALSRRDVRVALVGVPALLIALLTMAGLWRDLGREAEQRAAAAGAGAAP
jgi:hypothetical protein